MIFEMGTQQKRFASDFQKLTQPAEDTQLYHFMLLERLEADRLGSSFLEGSHRHEGTGEPMYQHSKCGTRKDLLNGVNQETRERKSSSTK